MFHKAISRNLSTRKKFLKFQFLNKSGILIDSNIKKFDIRNNIDKFRKDLSACLNDYDRKNNINNSLFKECKQIHEGFAKFNSKIRKNHKAKEKKLLGDIINDYYVKRHLNISKDELNENIFESSELLEANLKRLTMDYFLNHKRLEDEIKKDERKSIASEVFQNLPKTDRDEKQINLWKNDSDNNLPGVKLAQMIEHLKGVKFMKKIDLITKSKMMEDKKYNRYINKYELKTELKEHKKIIKDENNFNYKNFVRKSLSEIKSLQKNIQNEETNKNETNFTQNKLFYFKTSIKSVPELLYDKINKIKKKFSKNLTTKDSSSLSNIRFLEKSNSKSTIYEYALKRNKSDNIQSYSNNNNDFLPQLKDILKDKKFQLRKINSNLFKKTIFTPEFKTFNKKKHKEKDETSPHFNGLLNLTLNRNSIQNEKFMKTFLKDKSYISRNVNNNENSLRSYYDSLKKIHSQFDDDAKAEKLYDSNNLLNSRKMNYLFNKIKKFPEALKGKEKLLIKSLLIEKNQ